MMDYIMNKYYDNLVKRLLFDERFEIDIIDENLKDKLIDYINENLNLFDKKDIKKIIKISDHGLIAMKDDIDYSKLSRVVKSKLIDSLFDYEDLNQGKIYYRNYTVIEVLKQYSNNLTKESISAKSSAIMSFLDDEDYDDDMKEKIIEIFEKSKDNYKMFSNDNEYYEMEESVRDYIVSNHIDKKSIEFN